MTTAERSKPALPDSWVERIFDRMQGMYGSLWVDRWRTGETVERAGRVFDRGLLNAKATWAQELGGFAEQPERIQRALESCRSKSLPPTLPEFVELCRQQVAEQLVALPPPVPDAQKRAANIERAASIRIRESGDREWARHLRRLYLAGERLRPPQIAMASEALGETWSDGRCMPRVSEEA